MNRIMIVLGAGALAVILVYASLQPGPKSFKECMMDEVRWTADNPRVLYPQAEAFCHVRFPDPASPGTPERKDR